MSRILLADDSPHAQRMGERILRDEENNGGAPVFLTAGAVEPVDESEVVRVRADGVLKKPFEASLLLEAIGRFKTGAKAGRQQAQTANGSPAKAGPPRSVVVLDPEQVRAAVTVALDAALPALVEEISARVLGALAGSGRKAGV
jgi:CheY-like chemotaxis protein